MDAVVALFLDPAADSVLVQQTLQSMPIWIVNTPANRNVLPALSSAESSPVGRGWTVYNVPQPNDRLRNGLNILDTLHLHHGSMNELRVFGVSEAEARDPAWATAGFNYTGFSEKVATFACGQYNFD